jgi:hypothetical protein
MEQTIEQTFEDFLRATYAEHYTGTDDDMPDKYEYWLSNLETDEWIDLGNKYKRSGNETKR